MGAVNRIPTSWATYCRRIRVSCLGKCRSGCRECRKVLRVQICSLRAVAQSSGKAMEARLGTQNGLGLRLTVRAGRNYHPKPPEARMQTYRIKSFLEQGGGEDSKTEQLRTFE